MRALRILLVSVFLVVAAVLHWASAILDFVGRVVTARDLDTTYLQIANDWLAKHPEFGSNVIPLLLVGLAGLSLLATHLWPRFQRWLHPITIRFDEANPNSRFVSWETWRKANRSDVKGWEYRVEIFNNSGKTLKDVSAICEIAGEAPSTLEFSRTGERTCDIHPSSGELVKVFIAPEPPTTSNKFDVIVRARAKDTTEAVKRFIVDLSKQPSFFNKR